MNAAHKIKRWNFADMFNIGHRLFTKIHKRKHSAHYNHEIHYLAREIIETPRGYKNPGHGLALRGPLSQFFSGIFLKKLDDAFNNADVHYLRYQDDIIILCKTQRQLLRCRRRMMEVLHERGLSLSRKKSRMGSISEGFHFLGIHYLPTQTEECNRKTQANDDRIALPIPVHSLNERGGVRRLLNIKHKSLCASFHTQEHCARHVRILSGWSPMVSLTKRSEAIFITLSYGG